MAYVAFTSAQTDFDSPLDQAFFDQMRLNFEALRTDTDAIRAASAESIRTDFVVTALDTNLFQENGVASFVFNMGVNGEHVIRILAAANLHAIIAAQTHKMHFRLNKDMLVSFECRLSETAVDNPANIAVGFQDSSLAVSSTTSVSDVSDFIGFVKGTTSKQWKFRTAKGGTATESDDIGARDSKHDIRVDIARVSGVVTISAYFDDVAISGSPFTSASSIPDTVVLRPQIAVLASASNSASEDADWMDAFFLGKPTNV